jgi:hypothetical protein
MYLTCPPQHWPARKKVLVPKFREILNVSLNPHKNSTTPTFFSLPRGSSPATTTGLPRANAKCSHFAFFFLGWFIVAFIRYSKVYITPRTINNDCYRIEFEELKVFITNLESKPMRAQKESTSHPG